MNFLPPAQLRGWTIAWVSVFWTAQAIAQEWYIPQRTELLQRGSGEVGMRVQMSANNDGLLDTRRAEAVLHLRYSPLRRLEFYTEAPYAHVLREDVVAFQIVSRDTYGVGDAFAQISFDAFSREDAKILFHADGVWPFGKNPYDNPVGLGSGHPSAAIGQTAMKAFDPMVLFTYVGYQHSFPRRFGIGLVEPGGSVRFRLGGSLAVNPRLQSTLAVTTDVVSSSKIQGSNVAGSATTLVRLGWGLHWAVVSRVRIQFDAIFGMTKSASDATLILGSSLGF